jgi:hypothetical protein
MEVDDKLIELESRISELETKVMSLESSPSPAAAVSASDLDMARVKAFMDKYGGHEPSPSPPPPPREGADTSTSPNPMTPPNL